MQHFWLSCDLQGLSIACSTEHAIKWDAAWADSHEISGRAMVNVHDAQQHLQPDGSHPAPASEPTANGVSEVRGHRGRSRDDGDEANCAGQGATPPVPSLTSRRLRLDMSGLWHASQEANGPVQKAQPGREPDDGGLNNLSRVEPDGSLHPPDM